MEGYSFFTRNYFTGSGEYTISGENFRVLLDFCFQNSSYVSFGVRRKTPTQLSRIEKWRLDRVENLQSEPYSGKRYFYRACREILTEILSWTDDLFELYSMGEHVLPDDPEFYREDGSILFESNIHEGECSIYPRESEEISGVLQTGNWLRMDEYRKPNVPAIKWQYPLPEASAMLRDPLYEKLTIIMARPESHLIQFKVDEIDKIVHDYRPPFLKVVELPIPGASCLPDWYYAFKMFVLGKCNANTNVQIAKALADAGYENEKGFKRYFELLEEYADMVAGKSK